MNHGPGNFFEDSVSQQRRRNTEQPTPKPVDPETVSPEILASLQAWKSHPVFAAPPLASILRAVCLVTGVSQSEIASPRRQVHLVMARFVFYYICRQHTAKSFPEIGRFCGGRDHSTVMHGLKMVEERKQAYAPIIAAAKKLLGVA